MENINQQNLISGIVDAEAVPEASASSQSPNPAPRSDSLNLSEIPENTASQVQVVERLLDRTLDRFADKLREAEERGFRKALEMARLNPEQVGISPSVPNFLADIRPDIWDN